MESAGCHLGSVECVRCQHRSVKSTGVPDRSVESTGYQPGLWKTQGTSQFCGNCDGVLGLCVKHGVLGSMKTQGLTCFF